MKLALLCAASAIALAAGSPAAAQQAEAAPPAIAAQSEQAPVGDIVVTGSRLKNGNGQPTPVTIVSAEQLQATTPTSIPDALAKLPAFNANGSSQNSVSYSNGRGYNSPGNFLDLRGLTPIRTLILQDGNRVPGTFFDTTVDTNTLPQMLIQRVETVTGGASAVYGSDAVAGVVNFITDTKFTGLKGLIQGGVSGYGDAKQVRGGLAFGTKVGDRGHFEASAEYYSRDGVHDDADRPRGSDGSVVLGAGTAASPYTLALNGRQSNTAPGGLVTSGPIAGQMFNNSGQLVAFNPGAPTNTANVSIGGDGGYTHNQYVIPDFRSAQAFARFDYDFGGGIEGYVEGRYSSNRAFARNQIYTNTDGSYPITIYSGNAFLPGAQQAALTASGTSSFNLNRFDNDLMSQLGLKTETRADAFTAGLKGNLLGDLKWDAHFTHGDTRTKNTTENNVNTANFYAALDAVRDPRSGTVVCNVSLYAPSAFPGCAPLNVFGQGNTSQAARDFIFDDTSWTAKSKLEDAGANVTGTLFENWAGPVKVALGGEFRHASLDVTTTTPNDTFNPANLRLGAAGNAAAGSYPGGTLAYFKEVQGAGSGQEDIYEGSVEANIPLLKDLPFVRNLSFNGAYRHASYSASGNSTKSSFSADTWKLGLEWKVSSDLRLRGTRSRDFRAPTLWDLYQQQVISGSGISDPLTGVAGTVNTVGGGNPRLRPEIAYNTTAGIVLTPQALRGFSASFDYFSIKVEDAIGVVYGDDPTIQSLCLASNGSSPYCSYLVRPISYNSTSPANFPTLRYAINQNLAQISTRGFDVELNYASNLAPLGLPGNLSTRLLWSHQPVYTTQALPGSAAYNTAGAIESGLSGVPRDKVNLFVDYQTGPFSFNVLQRFISKAKQSAVPGTVYAIPDVPAYWQTDLNLSYDWKVGGGKVTTFLNISNLLDTQGGIFQTIYSGGSIGLRYPALPYADVIGRYFTLGARFKF
ncbi:TonB-dependent receptor [Sphingomonas sp. RB3P16]|uniref:TonB-dependent receptor plug domain-containing protein n=1 Tax=Parasphingomonas frigoris TaxID=3096163 RepID=UPI002FC9D44B